MHPPVTERVWREKSTMIQEFRGLNSYSQVVADWLCDLG